MHRKQLTHIFSLLLLFAACFLGGTLLARATASEAGESDNAGNETTGAANEAAGAVNETTGAASETAGAANEADASASKSWGLSYQEEGKRPREQTPWKIWPRTAPITPGTPKRKSYISPLTAGMKTEIPPKSWTP